VVCFGIIEIDGNLRIPQNSLKKKTDKSGLIKGIVYPNQPLHGVNLHDWTRMSSATTCCMWPVNASVHVDDVFVDVGDSWDWSIGQGRNTWLLEYLEYPLVN